MGTLPLRREKPWERDYFWRLLFPYACVVKYINLYIIYGIQDILYRKSLKIKNLTLPIAVVWKAFENCNTREVSPTNPYLTLFSLEDCKWNAKNPMYHSYEASWSSTWSKIACKQQKHFRSSLLSLRGRQATTGNASAVRRLDQRTKVIACWCSGTDYEYRCPHGDVMSAGGRGGRKDLNGLTLGDLLGLVSAVWTSLTLRAIFS